jgi:hypothetical protein
VLGFPVVTLGGPMGQSQRTLRAVHGDALSRCQRLSTILPACRGIIRDGVCGYVPYRGYSRATMPSLPPRQPASRVRPYGRAPTARLIAGHGAEAHGCTSSHHGSFISLCLVELLGEAWWVCLAKLLGGTWSA